MSFTVGKCENNVAAAWMREHAVGMLCLGIMVLICYFTKTTKDERYGTGTSQKKMRILSSLGILKQEIRLIT